MKDLFGEFTDKVDWYNISYYQTLSEGFIREFADKVFWKWIIFKQSISQDLMIEMMGRIQPEISEADLIERCQELDYEVEEVLKYYRMCQVC